MPWTMFDGGDPVLDEVIRVRLEREVDALALEDRQQLLHRPPELRFGQRGLFGTAVELGVHDGHAELDRDLDRALPVADGRLPLVLVGAGPAEQRQQARDLDPGVVSAPLNALIVALSTRGCRKKGMKSSRGDSSMCW